MPSQNPMRELYSKRPSIMAWLFVKASLVLVGCSLGAPPGAKTPLSKKPRVLFVGDSLTVDGFGEGMEGILIQAFGATKVAVYGCCGASVEHFLKDTPVFTCRCGYRETTPETKMLDNWEGGQTPRPVPTPKLATLLKAHQPEIVIVQLGTNNFDTLLKEGEKSMATQSLYFERFAEEVVSTTGSLRRAIWVAPPDSAKYPAHIEKAVDQMIEQAARKHGIHVIRSSQFTRYVMGKSGTDGVHYHTKSAKEWAEKVHLKLNQILFPEKGRTTQDIAPPSTR
ncbi:MAG: hypothetical protein ACI9NQ_000494 [Paracoccaceae bacterium]|jgi:hypothetical protein